MVQEDVITGEDRKEYSCHAGHCLSTCWVRYHNRWPVPANAINTNIKGIINQNIGYPGAENNVEPLIVPKEGTVLGPDVK